MSRKQSKSKKAFKMAEYLKKRGTKRQTARCPVCGRVVAASELQSHVAGCNGRR